MYARVNRVVINGLRLSRSSTARRAMSGETLACEMTEYDSIKSVADAIKILSDLERSSIWGASHYDEDTPPHKFPFGLWFRGAAQAQFEPVPSVFRLHARYNDETSIYRMSVIEQARKYSQTHHATLEWLTLMQHYGAPTRLLDWSRSVAIALWFAVCDAKTNPSNVDAAVWILNAARLNKHTGLFHRYETVAAPNTFESTIRAEQALSNDIEGLLSQRAVREVDDFDKPNPQQWATLYTDLTDKTHELRTRLSAPVAFYPAKLSERLASQQGVFTIGGGKISYEQARGRAIEDDKAHQLPRPMNLVELSRRPEAQSLPFLGALRVDGDSKENILRELNFLGFTEGFIYPEIPSVSAAIVDQFSHELPRV